MKRLLIFLIASLTLLTLAIILSQFSFPSDDIQPYGKMIRIRQDEIFHSSSAVPAFRRFWKNAVHHRNDSLIRMAVIAVDESDFSLRDSLVSQIRKSVHDPRIPATWNWSNNWMPANEAQENFIFNRPSFAVNLQSCNPQHDYTEAWVNCETNQAEENLQLTVFCKNNLPEINATLISDSVTASEKEFPVNSNWECLHFPFHSGKVQLNIRGEKSPVFGNITIEPVCGFSIWSVKIPEMKNASLRNEISLQAEALNPGMLILVCEKSKPEKLSDCIKRCRRIFGNKPILVYSSGLPYENIKTSFQLKASFLSGSSTSSIALVLQKDIRRLLREG